MNLLAGAQAWRGGHRALVAGALALAGLGGALGTAAQPLPALIDAVLAQHPSLRAQKFQGESARQALEGAQWQYFPTPSIGFEQVNTSSNDPNYPSYGDKNVTTLRLQQPLWTGGRLDAGVERAQAGVQTSQASLEGTRQDLALHVVQLYSDWYGAMLKRLALEKSLKAHQTLREQILRRIANGVSPKSDLTLLQGRQQQTEADLAAAQAQEQSALGRLSQTLGRPLQAQPLADSVGSALPSNPAVAELLEQAQAHNPSILKLRAQARQALAEIAERRADLSPEVYLRAERQYGNYAYPGSVPLNRYFVGFTSHFGAGLSSLSQVDAAQARYEAALADVEGSRISLGEQIQADYAQAEAGRARLASLQASLASSADISKAWGRQFVAGRKTWLDLMNAVREQAQLETQIAEAQASQLLLGWRLAIVGQGVDQALAQAAPAEGRGATLPSGHPPGTDAVLEADWSPAEIPLYPQDATQAITLQASAQLDPLHLGLALGLDAATGIDRVAPADTPSPTRSIDKESTW